jgi:hypothetical protein
MAGYLLKRYAMCGPEASFRIGVFWKEVCNLAQVYGHDRPIPHQDQSIACRLSAVDGIPEASGWITSLQPAPESNASNQKWLPETGFSGT